MVDGILGREDEEGPGGVGFVAERDLALLHGFEERALDLCWGSIDFVCEDEIEIGPLRVWNVSSLGL